MPHFCQGDGSGALAQDPGAPPGRGRLNNPYGPGIIWEKKISWSMSLMIHSKRRSGPTAVKKDLTSIYKYTNFPPKPYRYFYLTFE
jgi:hypothetical protein